MRRNYTGGWFHRRCVGSGAAHIYPLYKSGLKAHPCEGASTTWAVLTGRPVGWAACMEPCAVALGRGRSVLPSVGHNNRE